MKLRDLIAAAAFAAAGGAFAFHCPADRAKIDADPRVTAVAPVQSLSALLSLGDESRPVVVKGGAFADVDSIYGLSEKLVAGEITRIRETYGPAAITAMTGPAPQASH